MKQVLFARNLRHARTDAEQTLWFHFRNRRFLGLKFRRQHPIKTYVADFCCVEEKLIIEIDGGQHLTQQDKDFSRTAEFEQLGYRVIRFWNHEVLKDTEAVLESIRLHVLNPHPALSLGERRKKPTPALSEEGEGRGRM